LTATATQVVPLIVCGDINDGPGMDASEKRLLGSGVERLMGSIWRPELCLHNALFDILKPSEQKALKFENLATTNFADPIFNKTYHNEWIDHILHSRNVAPGWLTEPAIHNKINNQPIWKQYPYASDHYPVSVKIETEV
jgi:endonuclease/exonuclease/phosphatase family metal-dependent hydrolase